MKRGDNYMEVSLEPENRITELDDFYNDLCDYGVVVNHALNKKSTKKDEKQRTELVISLGRRANYMGRLITELTRLSTVDLAGKEYDMWVVALRIPADKTAYSAILHCIQVTNRAIGQLIDDIRNGVRDKQGNLIDKSQIASTEPPKAFIAHGGKSGVLDKLREFVDALGIKPIIVELSASKGMSVDDKVNKYIKDADCGIVLATGGGIIDKKSQKQHPRLNVIDEFERLRAVFPDKTILLLEKGVELPSNISGLTYEPFARQSMDRAFTAIVRELTAFGILRATKPHEEE